jgi:hypothetical protein
MGMESLGGKTQISGVPHRLTQSGILGYSGHDLANPTASRDKGLAGTTVIFRKLRQLGEGP